MIHIVSQCPSATPWPRQIQGLWHFHLYAPHAAAVAVLGDFSQWQPIPMQQQSPGHWSIDLDRPTPGQAYQFSITTADGSQLRKSDPCGPGLQKAPYRGSVLQDTACPWQDAGWMQHRSSSPSHAVPLLIYQLDLFSWRRDGDGNLLTLQQLTPYLIGHVKALGATHVQLSPAMARDSLGNPDSMFALDPRLGTLADFQALVDALHRAGVGVLMQLPLHGFSDNPFGLDRLDGQPVYEGDTPFQFDFSNPATRDFLTHAAAFWLDICHLDGFSLPEGSYLTRPGCADFLQEWNRTLRHRFPGILTLFQGDAPSDLGFDLYHHTQWQQATLDYLGLDPLFRAGSHRDLVRFADADPSDRILALSLEASGQKSLLSRSFGQDLAHRLAGCRLFYLYQLTHPGQKLISMGSEFAQENPWNPHQSLDWHLLHHPQHHELLQFYRAAGDLYLSCSALWQGSAFQWLVHDDARQNTLVYLRTDAAGRQLLVALNFSGVALRSFCVGVPTGGTWQVLLTSDDRRWGGHGKSSAGTLSTAPIPHHGMQQSLFLDLPPLTGLVLTPDLSPSLTATNR